MCRSQAEGGRRCPGGSARTSSPSAGRGATSRDAARARWAEAQRALDAAKAGLGPHAHLSGLLLGPLSLRQQQARGGNPSLYDDQVAQGGAMLTSLLVGDGNTPAEAAAKVEALAAAYAAWSATPEA